MNTDNKKIAGSLLFIAGAEYIFGAGAGVHYSNTTIVNVSETLLALIVIVSAYFIWKGLKSIPLSALLILAGIGSIGAAWLAAGTTPLYIFEGIGYVFFALAAIWSYKFETSPLNYMSVILGILAFVALALFASGVNLGSGIKVSALSVDDLILPWLVGFGANLIGSAKPSDTSETK